MKRHKKSEALIFSSIFIILAFASLMNTGIIWDENRYIAQAKARAYSIYAAVTGKPDLWFCDLTEDFGGLPEEGRPEKEWASRCWEGRSKLPITLSGIGWAFIWTLSGYNLDVISSIMAHRVAIVLMNALAIFIAYLFISEAVSRRAAIISSLALIFMPRLFAHSLYVLMDEPLVLFWVATLYLFWKGLHRFRYMLLSGVTMGMALATMDQALFIPIILLMWMAVYYRKADRKIWKMRAIDFTAFSIVALMVWFSLWPWVWHDTFNRLNWWVWYYTHHIEGGLPSVLFMGEVVSYPSWIYTFALFVSTIPLMILLLAASGVLFSIRDAVRCQDNNGASFMILLSAAAPLLTLSLISVNYNGAQHFIQSYFFAAMLAGIGADCLLKHRTFNQKSAVFAAIMAVLIIFTGGAVILQGHADTYFNSLVGGTMGVYHNEMFEVEWSGESYLEAAHWINDNVPENSTIYVPMADNIFNTYKYGDIGQIAQRMNVTGMGFDFGQKTLLRNDIIIIGYRAEQAYNSDYVVVMSRFGLMNTDYFDDTVKRCLSSSPAYSVISFGVPLTNIYELPCQPQSLNIHCDNNK